MVTIDLKCPFELTAWDRQTDRLTDGSQQYLMSTVGGHSNYRNRELRRVVVKPAGLQHDSNFEFGDLIITRLRWGYFIFGKRGCTYGVLLPTNFVLAVNLFACARPSH